MLFEIIKALLIVIASYLVNLLFSIYSVRNVRNYYAKVQSPELAMRRLDFFNGLPQIVLAAAGVIYSALHIIPLLDDSFFSGVIAILSPMALFMIVMLTTVLVSHSLEKEIRNITETKKERAIRTLRFSALLYSPMLIFYLLRILLPAEFVDQMLHGEMSGLLIPMSFLLLVFLIQPIFIGRTMKATVMPDSELRERLVEFTKNAKINNFELYIWPSTKERTANVLVTGYLKKKIYFADYLLENFSIAEVESILAHELGHIKHYHLWIKMAVVLLWYPYIQFIAYLGDTYAANSPDLLIILVLALAAALYGGVGYLYISRYQEKQADAFVIKIGVDRDVFVSSLRKLSQLNNTLMSHSKVEEAFHTHPSIARRITWVTESSNISASQDQR